MPRTTGSLSSPSHALSVALSPWSLSFLSRLLPVSFVPCLYLLLSIVPVLCCCRRRADNSAPPRRGPGLSSSAFATASPPPSAPSSGAGTRRLLAAAAAMSSIKTRLSHARAKLLRRSSGASSAASSAGSERAHKTTSSLRRSISLTRLPEASSSTSDVPDDALQRLSQSDMVGRAGSSHSNSHGHGRRPAVPESLRFRDRQPSASQTTSPSSRLLDIDNDNDNDNNTAAARPDAITTACPAVTIEEPTPVHPPVQPPPGDVDTELPSALSLRSTATATAQPFPPTIPRRQSLVAPSNARAIKTLLAPDLTVPALGPGPPSASDYFAGAATFDAGMLHRKIWVKRHNGSATLVQIREDDLVDDVREMILKKYGNSLGRSFDAPDLTLRILPRESTAKPQDRVLGPEEEMCRTLDAYFPGGQTVHEALIIEIPRTRTPKPSPRVPAYYAHHDDSQNHHQTEYFPLMPITNPSPATLSANAHEQRVSLPHAPHSISVIQTGQLPSLPSPGSARRAHTTRPKYPRHNTASPTTLTSAGLPAPAAGRPAQRPRHDSSASETKHSATSNPPLPTPPAPGESAVRQGSTPPIPRVSSPRPEKKRKKPKAVEPPSLPAGLLDNSVPPINVLIVEDNIINLRVLGAFMQRLKVRWQRAMNGKEAVTKWRAGGFHLVLMDIQLPIMDGLEATREIRRLERINSIGVFSSGSSEAPNNRLGRDGNYERELKDDDKLGDKNLFKSPVIIVALTASSLQSDRHEALAAGCNDFLTKVRDFFPPTSGRTCIITDHCLACQFCLARKESQGMGLHAGLD